MTQGLQWKVIAGFILVFIAGTVTGAFLAITIAHHMFFGGPPHTVVTARMGDRLRRELNLTPEQMAKISPVLDRTGGEMEKIRRDTARRVRAAFGQAHQEIVPVLTDEQRTKFEQMRERHRRWLHHRHPGAPEDPMGTPP